MLYRAVCQMCSAPLGRYGAVCCGGSSQRRRSGHSYSCVRMLLTRVEPTSRMRWRGVWCMRARYAGSCFPESLQISTQSVSQTLHTCTPSIVLPLLNYHLFTSSSAPRTHTLLQRLFTALIHHVQNADNFSPVGDILLDAFIVRAQGTISSENDLETLQRMVDVISIPASVRNGSRLTGQYS